ncbi:DUF1236 domain-containing protein [Aquicoccus sp. SCR17]|nr:DUF1236 domain-containing protein [Carideicomes alvinocaridis]
MFRTIATSTAAAALLATMTAAPVAAAVDANATTDLNLRAGPGPQFEVVDVIANEGAVTVEACNESGQWCRVSYEDQTGWAYSPYLTATVKEEPVYVSESLPELEVDTVPDKEAERDAAIGGGFVGSFAGALIAGPAGAAVGAIAGGATASASVPEKTVTYVKENRIDPVYLEGEVVEGAVVPEEVEIVTIPDSDYAYLYVNGVPAVIDPADRSIVRVVR